MKPWCPFGKGRDREHFRWSVSTICHYLRITAFQEHFTAEWSLQGMTSFAPGSVEQAEVRRVHQASPRDEGSAFLRAASPNPDTWLSRRTRVALEEIVTAPRPTDPGPREHDTALPRWLFSACVIVVYCLLGIVAFWPIYPGISQRLFSPEGDFTQSVWYLDWIPHAIAHGLNPFFSKRHIRADRCEPGTEHGKSFARPDHRSLRPVLNPVVRANLLMLLGMPVSATAAFVVLRKWKVWGPAAALGGLIYGFSPYMISQGLGHVELIFVPLPPFIALTIVSILQRRGRPGDSGSSSACSSWPSTSSHRKCSRQS